MKYTLLIINYLLISLSVFSINEQVSADSASINLMKQIAVFPQEKIHLHIDKPYYVLGEKIWIKCYLVNASNNHPVNTSRYIYLELVTPTGKVANRVKIRQDNNTYSGYIALDENLAEGNYTIRGYTNYMCNMDENYFAQKQVSIQSPISTSIEAKVEINSNTNGKHNASISMIDTKSGLLKNLDGLKITTNNIVESLKIKSSDTIVQVAVPKDYILHLKYGNYEKYITLPILDNDFEVSFHPEGGYLLEGIYSKVAFKALKTNGLSEIISGYIVDDTGTEIAKLETLDKGMGFFYLKPETGKTYYAKYKNSNDIWKITSLPAAVRHGYMLNVNTVNNKLYISVLSTTNASETEPLLLMIHTRGIPQYSEKWDIDKNLLIIDKSELSSGISEILLLDNNLNLLSKRLFFCINQDQAIINFSTDKLTYKSRELVSSNIEIKDSNSTPLTANLSVSITDDNDICIDEKSNILSTLLLTSELKGYIEKPFSYFDKDVAINSVALDLLMLTQGWTRYNIPEAIKGKIAQPKIPIEQSQNISGIVEGGILRTTLQANCKVSMLATQYVNYETTETDKTGHFRFTNFEFPDSTKFLIQALSKKEKDNVILKLDKEIFPPISTKLLLPYTTSNNRAHYVEKANLKYGIDSGIRMLFLEEVSVLGRKKEKKNSLYMNLAAKTLSEEEIERSGTSKIQDLLRRFSGVQIIGGRVYIRSSSPALIIIDDQIIENNTEDYNILDDLFISDIEEIGIFPSGGKASILGARGGSGAVVIRTKTGKRKPSTLLKQTNMVTITPLGYQKPLEFYSPKYEVKDIKKMTSQPDLRTTIYWNPNIDTSNLGKATFHFYTADTATSYSVIIEGITADGKIIYYKNKIKISD